MAGRALLARYHRHLNNCVGICLVCQLLSCFSTKNPPNWSTFKNGSWNTAASEITEMYVQKTTRSWETFRYLRRWHINRFDFLIMSIYLCLYHHHHHHHHYRHHLYIFKILKWLRNQICANKLTNIGSYNGLSPEQRQAIISDPMLKHC